MQALTPEAELLRRQRISEGIKRVRAEKFWTSSNAGKHTYRRCVTCSSPFIPQSRSNKYCSRKCIQAWNKGIKWTPEQRANSGGPGSPGWRGGVSSPNESARKTAQYREWRLAVFVRDDYTCLECGTKGGVLNADHIKPFAYYPDLRFNLDNGRTLCFDCHRKTPTWGNRRKV